MIRGEREKQSTEGPEVRRGGIQGVQSVAGIDIVTKNDESSQKLNGQKRQNYKF